MSHVFPDDVVGLTAEDDHSNDRTVGRVCCLGAEEDDSFLNVAHKHRASQTQKKDCEARRSHHGRWVHESKDTGEASMGF